jgi:hypothetical protein
MMESSLLLVFWEMIQMMIFSDEWSSFYCFFDPYVDALSILR